jgi:outer membrane protein assembly factor BamB
VYNGVLVLAPAGEDVLLAGVDPMSGEVLWTVPNDLNILMSHSSVMPMMFHGKRTFVYFGLGGIVGVSAEEYDMGTLLWVNNLAPWHPTFQVSPTPLQISPTDMLLTTGYGQGSGRLRVSRSGNQWTTALVEQWGTREGLSSEQQTPILHNNMIININTRDARADLRRRISMFTLNDLRNPVWLSEERICLGPYIVINNYLFVFYDFGDLLVYRIEDRSMTLLKRQMVVPDGFDAWGPIAYADGIIIVGDAYNIKALRIAYYEQDSENID